MKRLIAAFLVLLVLGGCNGVILNAEYSELLDRTAVLSDATARRADLVADKAAADGLTFEQMVGELRQRAHEAGAQALVWRKFREARDGRAEK